jgi:hypothetical protein
VPVAMPMPQPYCFPLLEWDVEGVIAKMIKDGTRPALTLTYRLLILSSYLKKQVYIIFMIRHEVIYVGKYQRKKTGDLHFSG